ncbi:MAG TPA: cupin domain-containing protein [Burkholderiaceae bacterium]|nr:cupin domain-containing protein [Burkholderiaceae bacterium]HRP29275.1 cupin domain-containing protein [Burkholderiaceae bacterium]
MSDRAAIKQPLTAAEVAPEVWYAGTDREIRGRALCDVGGKARLGVGLMELAPGSNTKPGHWHSHEEEHLYALSGSAVLHLGAEQFELQAGSYVCFPAGQPAPHHLQNNAGQPFVYLIIGERIADDRVTYPCDPPSG